MNEKTPKEKKSDKKQERQLVEDLPRTPIFWGLFLLIPLVLAIFFALKPKPAARENTQGAVMEQPVLKRGGSGDHLFPGRGPKRVDP